MKRIYNLAVSTERRKKLRQEQTVFESLLWGQSRNKRFHGLRFLRQFGVGKCIFYFYFPKRKFAIEVDGSQHVNTLQAKHDHERTNYLEFLGIRVFRVWNNDILQNMEGVLSAMSDELFKEKPPLSPSSVQGEEDPRTETNRKSTFEKK